MRKKVNLDTSKQHVLWVVANAGGVGKTTLAIQVGYQLAALGLDILFIDLDTNGSLARFCGLSPDLEPQHTTAAIFDRNFNGDYPIVTPEWVNTKGKFDLCLGGDVMLSVALDLPSRTGREFILRKTLKKHKLPHQLVILDSPASLDVLSFTALAASTHIVMPVPMSVKLAGIDPLLQWIRNEADALDLDPPPTLLGGIPMRVAGNADQQAFAKEIGEVFNNEEVHCFQGIRYSSEFENASNRGIAPLRLYRPKHPANRDFEPLVNRILELYK